MRLILIIRDSFNGKKEDFKLSIPIVPKKIIVNITTLTAVGYLMKCVITFLIA